MNIQNNTFHNQQLGYTGESIIASYLQKNGYNILERNYKNTFGEIDIIAKKGNILTFVEVKTRKNNSIELENLISIIKQKRMVKGAQLYSVTHNYIETILRFDVALVYQKNKTIQYKYIESAFMSDE